MRAADGRIGIEDLPGRSSLGRAAVGDVYACWAWKINIASWKLHCLNSYSIHLAVLVYKFGQIQFGSSGHGEGTSAGGLGSSKWSLLWPLITIFISIAWKLSHSIYSYVLVYLYDYAFVHAWIAIMHAIFTAILCSSGHWIELRHVRI